MYKVLGREEVDGYLGRYIVEFSIPWPEEARTVHLLMEYTSWKPGLLPLVKIGNRGYIRLKLWEGTYPYAFAINMDKVITDPENDNYVKGYKVEYLNTRIDVSIATIGIQEIIQDVAKPSLSSILKHMAHIALDESLADYVGDYWILRLRMPKLSLREVKAKYQCGLEEGLEELEVVGAKNDLIDYLEALIPCREGELRYLFNVRSGSLSISLGRGGPESSEYFLAKTNRVFSVSEESPIGVPLLEISLEDVMNRIGEVLNILNYLGIRHVRITLPPQTIVRPEELLNVGNSLTREIESDIRFLRNKGIGVFMDIPISYVSPCFHGFIDVIERGSKSNYWDWFIIISKELSRGLSVSRKHSLIKGSCYMVYEILKELESSNSILFEDKSLSLIRLNLNSLKVLSVIEKALKFWIKAGCQGVVIKRAYTIPLEVIDAITAIVKDVKVNALVLGEYLGDPTYVLSNTLIDGVVDTLLGNKLISLVTNVLPCSKFVGMLFTRYTSSPPHKLLTSYISIPTEVSCGLLDEGEVKLIYVILASLYGFLPVKIIDIVNCSKRVRKFLRTLVSIVESFKQLRRGFMRFMCVNGALLIRRIYGNSEVITLVNPSRGRVEVVHGILRGEFKDLIGKGKIKSRGSIKLAPKSALMLFKLS